MFPKPEEPSDCNNVCVWQILGISNVEIHKKLSLKMLLGQTAISTIMVSSVPLISNSSGNEFKQTDKYIEVSFSHAVALQRYVQYVKLERR